jgi:RNA polymerase sigma factor (sigma-70 family)
LQPPAPFRRDRPNVVPKATASTDLLRGARGYHEDGMTRTQRSFETLYHEHVSDVYRYALAVTGQTSDAEDVTQTTFLNAYRAYARGERPRKPQNWLLTIAHNVCRQRARFAYYRVREVELEENSVEALVPDDDVPTAEDIRRALSHLPFQQRAVLVMRELEGRTHAEIAELMGLTTQATEMLAFRARRALREHLAGSLTCMQAAGALDRQMDGTLDAESTGLLRAHLRECEDCTRLARRMRAQRVGWKTLALVPLPSSLSTFHPGAVVAGGGAAVGGAGIGAGAGVFAKVAAVTIAAATVGGSAYFVERSVPPLHHHATHSSKAQVRRHTTKHAAVAAATWHAGQTPASPTVQGNTPVRHHGGRSGKDDHPVPIVTVPAVPTGAAAQPPQTADPTQPDQSTASDQASQPDATQPDQSTQPDQATQPDQPPDPTPAPPTAQQPGSQGVRAHGSPTPPAHPTIGGPEGSGNATPPPFSTGG